MLIAKSVRRATIVRRLLACKRYLATFAGTRIWLLYICCQLLVGGAMAQPSKKALPRRSLRTSATRRDSVRADSVRWRLVQLDQQKVLDSLRAISRRRTVLGRLARVVFDFRERRDDERGLDAALLDRQYDRHRYKVVRNIAYTRLDPFGYSVDNLTRTPTRFWEKAGNAIHITTHRGVIRRALLFRVGESLEPLSLSESERLLRATPFIGDARVIVNEATSTDDSVDVIVVTKDDFSFDVSASASPSNSEVNTGISDDNFLGLGHQVGIRAGRGYPQPDPKRLLATYAVNNIGRQFVSGVARYERRYGFENGGLNLERGFITANTRWAGGVAFNWYNTLTGADGVSSPANPPQLPRERYGVQDYWLGRAFVLPTYDLERTNHPRFVTAGRIISTTHTANSDVSAAEARTLILGAAGISFRRYYRDRYLFQFGRTEDIPSGNLLTITTGYDFSPTLQRPYYGGKAALGQYSARFGYLYTAAEVSAYRRAARWEQGQLSLETQYFAPRAYFGTWQSRQFLWIRATLGYRRPEGELPLNINQQDGLRGFRSALAQGQRRVVINYENTVFTPLSFLGLRVAGIVFADLAWLAPTDNSSPLKTKPYPGFGLGLRLRNDYIAFRTIQLLLGYYPNRPIGEELAPLRFFETARPFVPFRDFGFTQPSTSSFR
jgi:hypothetical protein